MVQVYFEDIKTKLLNEINKSEKQILIAIAWFTDKDLFEALLVALQRKVKVRLILMRDYINCSDSDKSLDFSLFLQFGGELYFFQSMNNLMHNKFCVIDANMVISGSYNWTNSARENIENIRVIGKVPWQILTEHR